MLELKKKILQEIIDSMDERENDYLKSKSPKFKKPIEQELSVEIEAEPKEEDKEEFDSELMAKLMEEYKKLKG